jgi:multimeric flavodoxin WrbA
MGKNILVITGSPRKNGNSEMLADAFIKGAQSAGHETSKFEAAFKKISGCIACDKCWSADRACSANDEFALAEPLLEKADMIVFAFPLYWFSFPAQIKAFIDKLYAYLKTGAKRPLKIKTSAMLIAAGDENISVLDGIKKSFGFISSYMKWDNLGTLEAIGINVEGEIKETDYLAKAEEFGKSIIQ